MWVLVAFILKKSEIYMKKMPNYYNFFLKTTDYCEKRHFHEKKNKQAYKKKIIMASFFGNKCTNLKFWGENSYPVLSYPLTPLDCLQGASTKCSTECSAVPSLWLFSYSRPWFVSFVFQLLLLVSVWFVAFSPPPSFLSFQSSPLSFCVPLCLFLFYFGKCFFLCL